MAATDRKTLLSLKKRIRFLQRRDEKNRGKLRIAVKKMKVMSKQYKHKLAGRMRIMKLKMRQVKSSTYAKVAADLERQLSKDLVSKSKSLTATIAKLDKKNIAKLKKDLTKKGKKSKSAQTKHKGRGTTVRTLRRNAKARRRKAGTGLMRSGARRSR